MILARVSHAVTKLEQAEVGIALYLPGTHQRKHKMNFQESRTLVPFVENNAYVLFIGCGVCLSGFSSTDSLRGNPPDAPGLRSLACTVYI